MAKRLARSAYSASLHKKKQLARYARRYDKIKKATESAGETMDLSLEDFIDTSRFVTSSFEEAIVPFRNSTIIMPKFDTSAPAKFADSASIPVSLAKAHESGFFAELSRIVEQGTKKHQTGAGLMRNVQELNNISFSNIRQKGMPSYTSMAAAAAKMQNILTNGGVFGTWDLETLGGVNSFGLNQIDAITEFSYTLRKTDGRGGVEAIENIQNVIGLKNADEIAAHIKGLDPNNLSKRDKVLLNRLSTYGNEGTVFEKMGVEGYSDGAAWRVSKYSDDIAGTWEEKIERSLKGIGKLGDVHTAQEAAAKKDGRSYVADQMERLGTILNGKSEHGHIPHSGYNTAVFDDPTFKYVAKRDYGVSIDIRPEDQLDVYAMNRAGSAFLGETAMYDGDFAGYDKKSGINTLINANNRFLGEDAYGDLVPHIAATDEAMFSKLLTQKDAHGKTAFSVIQENFNKAMESTYSGTYTGPNQQLFMLSSTDMITSAKRTGGLSFRFDPVSGTYKTFSGHEVGAANGGSMATKAPFAESGPKSKGLYTRSVVKIDTTEEFSKIFGSGMDNMSEFAGGEMYAILSTPFNNEMEGHYVQFARTLSEVESLMTQVDVATLKPGIDPMAKDADGRYLKDLRSSWEVNERALDSPDMHLFNPQLGPQKATLDDIVDIAEERQKQDSASRYVRGMNFKKWEKIRAGREKIDELLPVDKNASTRVRWQQREMELAKFVSQGGKITHELFDYFSYYDRKMEKQVLSTNNIMNVLRSYDHLASADWLMDSVYNAVNTAIPSGEKPSSAQIARQNLAFQNALEAAIDFMASDYENVQAMATNGSPVKSLMSSMNYVELSREALFGGQSSLRQIQGTANSASKDIVRLNLDSSKELLKTLHAGRFGSRDFSKMDSGTGYSLLADFVEKAKEAKLLTVEDDINASTFEQFQNGNGSPDLLAAEILGKIKRNVREERGRRRKDGSYINPTFGILDTEAYHQDISRSFSLVAGASEETRKKVLNVVSATVAETPNVTMLGDEKDIGAVVQKVMDQYTMPISKADYEKQIGYLSETDRKTLLAQYDMVRNDVKAQTTDFVMALSKSGKDVNLLIANDLENSLMLTKGSEFYSLQKLPSVKSHNGTLHVDIDGNNYVMRNYFDAANNTVRSGYGYVKPGEYGVSITNSVKRATQNGEDSFEALIGGIGSWKKHLRGQGVMAREFNVNTHKSQFKLDINSIVQELPRLHKDRVLDGLVEKGVIDSRMLTEIEELLNPTKYTRNESLSALKSTQRNSLVERGLMAILNYYRDLPGTDATTRHYLQNINYKTKDTNFAEGHLAVGNSYLTGILSAYDNPTKPTLNQVSNMVLYDREKVTQGLAGMKGVKVGSTIVDDYLEKQVNNVVDTSTGRTMTGMLSTKYINMDGATLSNVLENEIKDGKGSFHRIAKELAGKDGDVDAIAKGLYETVKSSSVYAQEMVLDSQVHDVIFNRTEAASISKKKALLMEASKNIDVADSIQNSAKLKLEYRVDPSTKQVTVWYNAGKLVRRKEAVATIEGSGGRSSDFFANHDGLLKGRYHDKSGNVVSEEELNRAIKGLSMKEAEAKLESLYDYSYDLVPKYEEHGTKLFTGPEKGVARSNTVGMGAYDKTVANVMKTIGLGDEVGSVYSSEYLNEYVFGKIDETYGAQEASSIKKRILKERHAASNALFGAKPFQGVDAHLIRVQDELGHEHISNVIRSRIGLLEENGLLDESYLKYFEGLDAKLVGGKLHLGSDPTGSTIDVTGLMQAADKALKDAGVEMMQGNWFYGWTDTSQVHDDAGGTGVDGGSYHELKRLERNLREKMRDIDNKITAEEDPGIVAALLEEKTGLEKELKAARSSFESTSQIGKGLKYSDRTALTLNRAKYNNSMLKNMRAYLRPEEYESVVKDLVNENGELKEELLGLPVLAPYTDAMLKQVLRGDGDKTLADLDPREIGKYKHLLDRFDKDMRSEVSLEKAKLAYSIGAGNTALEFNQGAYSELSLKEMTEEGRRGFKYRMAKAEELDLDSGVDPDTILRSVRNPYGNELMIDAGEAFEDSQRYLAIGRGLEQVSGDGIIKEDHTKLLARYKDSVAAAYEENITKEDREKAIQKAAALREEIIKQQKIDIGSKEGYAAEFTETRLKRSSYGKGGVIGVEFGGTSLKSYEALTDSAEKYKVLKRQSPSYLDQATFNGKSLLEHYSEGKYIDAQFRSEQAFRDMGYFDQDVMEKRLKNIDAEKFGLGNFKYDRNNVEANEEATRKLLERYGDITLSTRFPEIQEGSSKPTALYLNRELLGNEVKSISYSAESMKLDADGDKLFAATMATQSGNSYLDSLLGSAPEDEDLKALVNAQKTYMYSRSVGQNRYFERKFRKDVDEAVEQSIESGDWSKITDGLLIDGKALPYMGSYDQESVLKSVSNVKTYVDQATEALLEDDTYNSASLRSQGQMLNDKVVELIKRDGGDSASALIRDFGIERKYNALRMEEYSKVLKLTVGEVNTTAFKFRKLYDAFADHQDENINVISNAMQSVLYQAEEAAISAKKVANVDSDLYKRASVFTNALNGVLDGRGNAEEHINTIDSWMRTNVKKKIEQEADFLAELDVDFKERLANSEDKGGELLGEVYNALRKLSRSEGIQQVRRSGSLSFGENLSGLDADKLNNLVIAAGDRSIQAQGIRVLSDTGMIGKAKEVLSNNVNVSGEVTRSIGRTNLVDGTESLLTQPSAMQEAEMLLRNTADVFSEAAKNIDGKTLAAGALGLAGAFMVAGFVGGNPAAPADTQAMEASDEGLYDIPSLSDQGSSYGGARTQPGYVVNINARTRKGRQHVQNTINSAMTSSVSSDVNVNMNINDESGNTIDSRYLDRLLAGAI